MFEHLPAFSKFRVPKMILFLFAFGAAVLAGKGVDLLEEGAADRKKLVRWLVGSGAFVALIGLFWLFLTVGVQTVISFAAEFITAPTRYQSGPQLVTERYVFMHRETGIAFGLACLYCAAFVAWYKKWLPSRVLLPLLVVFLLGDLWRVNDNFFVLTAPPQANKAKAKNDVVTFLENRIDHYRLQPINDENAHYYTDYGFANVSAYVTISERRYKEYLDNFSLTSPMPDIMNLKYLIMPAGEYQSQKGALSGKYQPVFTSSSGSVVLENTTVLPKAWLVPSVAVVPDPQQQLGIMSSDPNFRPAMIALVETPPPLPMAQYGQAAGAGSARVDSYEANRIKAYGNGDRQCPPGYRREVLCLVVRDGGRQVSGDLPGRPHPARRLPDTGNPHGGVYVRPAAVQDGQVADAGVVRLLCGPARAGGVAATRRLGTRDEGLRPSCEFNEQRNHRRTARL